MPSPMHDPCLRRTSPGEDHDGSYVRLCASLERDGAAIAQAGTSTLMYITVCRGRLGPAMFCSLSLLSNVHRQRQRTATVQEGTPAKGWMERLVVFRRYSAYRATS